MSAIGLREKQRAATAARIVRGARRLADQHGVDGFTLDDLAEAAGVSRRTLFNYFPTKYDAVLGEEPIIAPELMETFRAGGPTGDLVEDLLVLIEHHFGRTEETAADLELLLRVLRANPPLIGVAADRATGLVRRLSEDFVTREGPDFDPRIARATLVVLIALVHAALTDLIEGTTEPGDLATVIADYVRAARSVFALPASS